mmetsp:Transcript_37390/g.112026  ORF Transcript_37390/g.112026 Transcript_37390/m.112026 type:complete len:95 (+) Transcript_37390:2122-2406(+)
MVNTDFDQHAVGHLEQPNFIEMYSLDERVKRLDWARAHETSRVAKLIPVTEQVANDNEIDVPRCSSKSSADSRLQDVKTPVLRSSIIFTYLFTI